MQKHAIVRKMNLLDSHPGMVSNIQARARMLAALPCLVGVDERARPKRTMRNCKKLSKIIPLTLGQGHDRTKFK